MKFKINNENVFKLRTFENKIKLNKNFNITFFDIQNTSITIKEKCKKLYKYNTKYK